MASREEDIEVKGKTGEKRVYRRCMSEHTEDKWCGTTTEEGECLAGKTVGA